MLIPADGRSTTLSGRSMLPNADILLPGKVHCRVRARALSNPAAYLCQTRRVQEPFA